MRSRIAILATVPVLLGSLVACGGTDEDDQAIRDAARAALAAELRDDLARVGHAHPMSTFVRAEVPAAEAIEFGDLTVDRAEDGSATVRAAVSFPVRLIPEPEVADMLRVLEPGGVAAMVSWPVSVTVRDSGEAWEPVPDSVEVAKPAALPPAAQQAAQQTGVDAVTALFTFTGDVTAYNEAQRFYATRPGAPGLSAPGGEVAEGSLPVHLDPAPTLRLVSSKPHYEALGSVWIGAAPRRGAPESEAGVRPLVKVLARDVSPDPCTGFEATTMSPGKVTTKVVDASRGNVSDTVTIEGETTVNAGTWTGCTVGFASAQGPDRIGPATVPVRFRLGVTRYAVPDGKWFVTGVTLSEHLATGIRLREPEQPPNLYRTE